MAGFMYKSMLFLFFLAGCMILFPLMALTADVIWEKTEEDLENDIVVFTRSVEGSSIKAYQGRTTVDETLDALVSLISDTEAFPEWMHNVKRAGTIDFINDTERIVYVAQGTPWPVRDRDLVLYSKLEVDPDTKQVTIYIEARPDAYPEQEGYLRIREMESMWQFTPMEDGMVSVVYETYVDPGGNIPPQVVNLHTLDTPLNSLLGLRRMIKEPRYRDAVMEILHRP